MGQFGAHRQHPKLPMLQLRFNKPGAKPEDVTLVFKDLAGDAPRLDVLTAFLSTFTATFQQYTAAAAAAAAAPLAAAPVPSVAPPLPIPAPAPAPAPPKERRRRPSVEQREVILEDQRRLLEEDEELAYAYEYLVLRGHIPASQFWEEHSVELAATQSQRTPTEEVLLAVPPRLPSERAPPTTTAEKPSGTAGAGVGPSTKGPSFHATAQQLAQILEEHPPIKARYDELVPLKVSHDEFWARFFHSRYFAQMIGRTPPPGADTSVFPDFDADAVLPVSRVSVTGRRRVLCGGRSHQPHLSSRSWNRPWIL